MCLSAERDGEEYEKLPIGFFARKLRVSNWRFVLYRTAPGMRTQRPPLFRASILQ
jgi:hypothetical protein